MFKEIEQDVETLKRTLPEHLRSGITEEFFVNMIEGAQDPIAARDMVRNFIDFSSVLKSGSFRLQDYMNAVKYATYKFLGNSNKDAYAYTFPERMIEMGKNGYSDKKISSFVANYNKNKIVNLIMEQTMVEAWVLHNAKYHKAIEVQADLMINAESEFVRSNAADSLIRALQKPKEAANVNLSIGVDVKNSAVERLAETLDKLSNKQTELLRNGIPATKVMELSRPVSEAEYVEVDADGEE